MCGIGTCARVDANSLRPITDGRVDRPPVMREGTEGDRYGITTMRRVAVL